MVSIDEGDVLLSVVLASCCVLCWSAGEYVIDSLLRVMSCAFSSGDVVSQVRVETLGCAPRCSRPQCRSDGDGPGVIGGNVPPPERTVIWLSFAVRFFQESI